MFAIVCVDRNWNIGHGGSLLYKTKEDMRYFRCMTTGETVIMGKKTHDSIIAERDGKSIADVLSFRRSVVLTHTRRLYGCVVYNNIEDLIANVPEDSYVIGGREVYEQLMPYIDRIFVTYIDEEYPEADVAFPVKLTNSPEWECLYKGDVSCLTLMDGTDTKVNGYFMTFGRVQLNDSN